MLDTTKILAAIDAWSVTQPEERYEVHIPSEDGKPRKYLGLSALGEECKRKVWLSWRHCGFEKFPPRLYRLFRRGHREEYVFINMLRAIGFEIYTHDENGKQFKVTDYEGHLSGHLDSVGKAPRKFWRPGYTPAPFLLEYKSYNVKRFVKLTRESVRKSDPKYYTQMQTYMGYMELSGALFCAVCKDDDALHFEWVPFIPTSFAKSVEFAGEVIGAQSPGEMPKISETASWYQCKYCPFTGICHGKDASAKSCRSCAYAEPAEAAGWTCTKGGTYGELCNKWKDIARV